MTGVNLWKYFSEGLATLVWWEKPKRFFMGGKQRDSKQVERPLMEWHSRARSACRNFLWNFEMHIYAPQLSPFLDRLSSTECVGQTVELLSRHSLKPFRNELDLTEIHIQIGRTCAHRLKIGRTCITFISRTTVISGRKCNRLSDFREEKVGVSTTYTSNRPRELKCIFTLAVSINIYHGFLQIKLSTNFCLFRSKSVKRWPKMKLRILQFLRSAL
jgi:hypothetical protein